MNRRGFLAALGALMAAPAALLRERPLSLEAQIAVASRDVERAMDRRLVFDRFDRTHSFDRARLVEDHRAWLAGRSLQSYRYECGRFIVNVDAEDVLGGLHGW